MIEIPWKKLDQDTLTRLLEEITTRDGTDYGCREKNRLERMREARLNLERGRAKLIWDEQSESASLVDADCFKAID